MSETPASPPAAHLANLPVSVVLGLSDKGDVDWARLRGLQYSALAKLAFYRVFVHALLAVFAAQIYLASVGLIGLGLWMVLLAAVHFHGYKHDNGLADADRRRITRDEVKRQTMQRSSSGLSGALRSSCSRCSAADSDRHGQLWSSRLLMTASAFFCRRCR